MLGMINNYSQFFLFPESTSTSNEYFEHTEYLRFFPPAN